MVKSFQIAATVIALCGHCASAGAQAVYRCGDSYGNQPCAGASVVLTDDPRSAAQRAATEAATRRDAQSAAAMEKERVKLEGQPAQATIPPERIEPPKPVAEAPVARRKSRPRKAELFTAVAPRKPGDAGPKKKGKGRKAAKTATT